MFKDTPRPTTVFGNSCRGRRRGGGRCSFEVQAVRGRGQYQSPAGTAATCAWNKMINIRTRRSRSIGICSFCRFAPYLPVIGAVQARRSGAGRCFEVSLARCPDTGENGISFGSSVVSIHSLRPRVLEQRFLLPTLCFGVFDPLEQVTCSLYPCLSGSPCALLYGCVVNRHATPQKVLWHARGQQSAFLPRRGMLQLRGRNRTSP